jgi:hypothetical protein
MAWDCGDVHYFDLLLRRCLALNIHTSVSGHYSEINRRSAALGCPRFAYSFLSLMLANTICTAIRAPLIGEAERINKNP